jgi:hypothetical protein
MLMTQPPRQDSTISLPVSYCLQREMEVLTMTSVHHTHDNNNNNYGNNNDDDYEDDDDNDDTMLH